MFYIRQHILDIIGQYQLQLPLHHYLRTYFKNHPKLGSRDRKAIADAVYAFYRVKLFLNPGNEIGDDVQEALRIAGTNNAFLKKVFAIDNEDRLPEKLILKKPFPELSAGISADDYFDTLRKQPDVFIRLMRNEKENLQILQQEFPDAVVMDTPFFKDRIVRLPGNSKLQNTLPESDYIIQDLSSQLSLQFALIHAKFKIENSKSWKAWDVCSGAGGKTILIKNIIPDAKIIATDIRESILSNLRDRIKKYHLKDIITLEGDVAKNTDFVKPFAPFDLIICDVPCSGSGTWARTPEYFYFFDEKILENYTSRQFQIVANAQQYLREGGYLCYITCSVFKAENENVTAQITAKTRLKLLHQQIINGAKNQADSMFMAVWG